MKRYWQANKYLLHIVRITHCLSVNFFSLLRIRSITQDHSDHGALRYPMNESILGKDLSLPMMHSRCYTSHLRLLILIRIIPMELIQILVIICSSLAFYRLFLVVIQMEMLMMAIFFRTLSVGRPIPFHGLG